MNHKISSIKNRNIAPQKRLRMKNLVEMMDLGPTLEDTFGNRCKEFALYSTTQFFQRAATEIIISEDKKNAEPSTCSKYLGKIVDASVTGTYYFLNYSNTYCRS